MGRHRAVGAVDLGIVEGGLVDPALQIVGILWPPQLCGALRATRWFPVVVIFDAAHRPTEVTRTPSDSFAWNGGCHVGTVLPQANDGRPDSGVLARIADRGVCLDPLRSGLFDAHNSSAGPDPRGIRILHQRSQHLANRASRG